MFAKTNMDLIEWGGYLLSEIHNKLEFAFM
jgi:hypothetical protein